MKLDYIGLITQAMYKSGKMRIEYADVPEILKWYYGDREIPVPTVPQFLEACREFGDSDEHPILGGRKSKNPCLFLYANASKRKRQIKRQRWRYF